MEQEKMPRTVAEQIAALENARAAKSARMSEVLSKSIEEGRSTDEAEQEEFDTLQREVEAIDGDLKRFRALEKTNAAAAKPVPQQTKTMEEGTAARSGGYVRVQGVREDPGIRFAKVVRCLGLAQGNRAEAARLAEYYYGDDAGIINVMKAASHYGQISDVVVKAPAVSGATTLDPVWAGPLVGDETAVFADFVEFLRPMTILGKFGTGGVPELRRVPFRTALLGQTTGGAGYWVGEGAGKPLTKFDFSRTTLAPLKVANITVATEELLRDSSPSAATLLRDGLAAALTERLDIDFIDPGKAASANISPASITNGLTAIQSAGQSADAVRADVRTVMQAFINANNPPTAGVWVMKSTTALALSLMVNTLGEREFDGITMNGGTFAGLPVVTSQYVPASGSPTGDYVVLVNASDIWFADEGGISIDMSREASLEMDAAPANTVGGSATDSPSAAPVGASLVSLWQTNAVGFRAERTVNWARRRASGVQLLWGVQWGT